MTMKKASNKKLYRKVSASTMKKRCASESVIVYNRLSVKTTDNNAAKKTTTFNVGRFRVVHTTRYYADLYSRYAIFDNGVLVREQITYPCESDGHYGRAYTLAYKELSEEDREKLLSIRPSKPDETQKTTGQKDEQI